MYFFFEKKQNINIYTIHYKYNFGKNEQIRNRCWSGGGGGEDVCTVWPAGS